MKKIIIGCMLALSTVACSDRDQNLVIEENSNSTSLLIFSRSSSEDEKLKSNLVEFYQQHEVVVKEMANILELNANFIGDANFYNEMTHASSELEILQVFSKYGLNNRTEDFLTLIKEKDSLSEKFSSSNPYLYTLPAEVRTQLIDDIPITVNDTDDVEQMGRTCAHQYKVDRSRCVRNYVIAGIGIVATAPFAAGIGTYIAVAVNVAVYGACLDDANSDYASCED